MEKKSKELVNILPSYQIERLLLSKGLEVENDSFSFFPPGYETVEGSSQQNRPNSPANEERRSRPSLNRLFSSSNTSTNATADTPTESYRPPVVIDETSQQWQNTMLANVNSLTDLSNSDNKYANAIRLEVKFTEEQAEVGVQPKFIDPSKYEYKQGDLINGYFLVENISDEPIPFDMFYVSFEGIYRVQVNPNKVVVKKFLDMIDMSASWHYGHFNGKQVSVSPMYEGPNNIFIDHLDGSQLSFGHERVAKPHVKHKRFFTFKIPNQILESSCIHSLTKHTEIPPTIGKIDPNNTDNVRDFNFHDTCISYSISARFIGKASTYGIKHSSTSTRKGKNGRPLVTNEFGDEYLILQQKLQVVRIVEEIDRSITECSTAYLSNKLLYENLLSRIDETLESNLDGTSIEPVFSPGANTPSLTPIASNSSTTDEYVKFQQLYRPSHNKKHGDSQDSGYYKVFLPIEKRTLGSTKFAGNYVLTTPKKECHIKYIPPIQYRVDEVDDSSWKIRIPIVLEFALPSTVRNGRNSKIPQVKNINVELVVLSVKSDIGYIPIEFTHDMITNNKNSKHEQYLEDTILRKLRSKYSKLKELSKKMGSKFRMEVQLAQDLEVMCNLKTKIMNLAIDDPKVYPYNHDGKSGDVNKVDWYYNESSFTHRKNFEIEVDLTTTKFKGEQSTKKPYDSFCLIPDFQSCHLARFYFLKITFKLQKGETLYVNVPVEIDK